MKKYLVDIHLPTADKHYDVYLPAGKQIGETIKLLIEIAESLTHGGYRGTVDSMLFKADVDVPLDKDISVYDAGIRNSSRLVLI